MAQEEYNEGLPYMRKEPEAAKRTPDPRVPKAPSVGKSYAVRKAGKYGDVRTGATMMKINAAGGKRRAKK